MDEDFMFDAFRLFVEVMLHSLDYLHRECQIIHTGKNFFAVICNDHISTFTSM